MEKIDVLSMKIAELSDETAKTLINCDIKEFEKITETLEEIIKKIDLDDFLNNGGVIKKIFNKIGKDKTYEKYNEIGKDIKKSAIQLKVYEKQLKATTKDLKALLSTSIKYLQELEEQISSDKINNDLEMSKVILIQNITILKDLLEVYQSLYLEISQSFMITLPIFNQCIDNIIAKKQNEMNTEAFLILDKKTSDYLKKNDTEISKNTQALIDNFGDDVIIFEKTINTINESLSKTSNILKKHNF